MITSTFLNITDLTSVKLGEVLELAQRPAASLGRPLDGEGVALIFEKPSNRTRHSTEMAVVQLGGHPVYTKGDEIGLDVRESVEEIVQVLGGYHALICVRVFDHTTLQRMQAVSKVPIVNLLSDVSHPLQAVADVLTMQQQLGNLAGKTVAYVGDFNNVARSLCQASALLGMNIQLGCPDGYAASTEELQSFLALGSPLCTQVSDIATAVSGAHAVHTDTWTSMGQESEMKQREKAFNGFEVTTAIMELADPKAIFMHCMPAHRGSEVSADVIDGARSVIYQQAHNRMHATRAVLAYVLGVRP